MESFCFDRFRFFFVVLFPSREGSYSKMSQRMSDSRQGERERISHEEGGEATKSIRAGDVNFLGHDVIVPPRDRLHFFDSITAQVNND
jgi:hypothetical protein